MKKSLFVFGLAGLMGACSPNAETKSQEAVAKEQQQIQEAVLASWEQAPKERIVGWVETVTNEGSADFIPETDRIAVFDNDGTLWPEQPVPNQLIYAADYIKAHISEHPEWNENEVISGVANGDLEPLKKAGMKGLLDVINVTHTGMTESDFAQGVQTWSDTATYKRYGKKYTEVVYQPMLELLEYLRENGFKTYIVSGGGADFMRAWTEEVYGIPPYQVVGSYGEVKYEVVDGKPVITKVEGDIYVDDKGGKPQAIHRFIGKVPVFCGGNSDGDQAMMQYTSGSPYKSMCLIVRHTDADREYQYETKTLSGHLETALVEAKEKDWMVVDMKTDWKKVFPFE